LERKIVVHVLRFPMGLAEEKKIGITHLHGHWLRNQIFLSSKNEVISFLHFARILCWLFFFANRQKVLSGCLMAPYSECPTKWSMQI